MEVYMNYTWRGFFWQTVLGRGIFAIFSRDLKTRGPKDGYARLFRKTVTPVEGSGLLLRPFTGARGFGRSTTPSSPLPPQRRPPPPAPSLPHLPLSPPAA